MMFSKWLSRLTRSSYVILYGSYKELSVFGWKVYILASSNFFWENYRYFLEFWIVNLCSERFLTSEEESTYTRCVPGRPL